MSGRHKPLMHVIFLFPPAISPAFPHRSLLSPNHFKNGIYFCLKNHALSLLIQGVRLHWDSKHTFSLNKLDIHFSPTRRYLLANQVWLGVVTSRYSFRESLKSLERSYWSSQLDCSQEQTMHRQCMVLSCAGDRAGSSFFESHPWTRCSYAKLLCLFLQSSAGSRLPSTEGFLLQETRVKPQQTRLAVLFCSPFLPDSLCMTSSTGSQGFFSHTTSSLPVKYSGVNSIFRRHLFLYLLFKVRHSKAPNAKAKAIWATSPLIFCLSSSLIWCTLYQK